MKNKIKLVSIFTLLFLTSSISVFAQEPLWWTQQKKDCNLSPKLTYIEWNAQGNPCNKAKPAVNVPSNNSSNDANAALRAKEEAEEKVKYEAEKKAREEAEAKKKKEEEEKRGKEKQEALNRMKGSSSQNFGINSSSSGTNGLKGEETNNFGLKSTGAFGTTESNPTKKNLNDQSSNWDQDLNSKKALDQAVELTGGKKPPPPKIPNAVGLEEKENKLAEKHPDLVPYLKKERELKKKSDELSKKTDEIKNQIKTIPPTDPKQKELVTELVKVNNEKTKVDGDKNMATLEKETKMNSYGVDVNIAPPANPKTKTKTNK